MIPTSDPAGSKSKPDPDTLDPAGSGSDPDPPNSLDIRPDPDLDPVHPYFLLPNQHAFGAHGQMCSNLGQPWLVNKSQK